MRRLQRRASAVTRMSVTGSESMNVSRTGQNPGAPFMAATLVICLLFAGLVSLAAPLQSGEGGADTSSLAAAEARLATPPAGPFDDVGNQTRGGTHLLDGSWWEGRLSREMRVADSDGDGIENANDTHPFDDHLPNPHAMAFAHCRDATAPCSASVAGLRFNETPDWESNGNSLSDNALIVDWNRDGYPDIIRSVSNGLKIHWGALGGASTAWDESINPLQEPIKLETADVDGDGWPDLVAGSWSELYWNNQGARYNATPDWSRTLGRALAAADLDQDGDIDLVSVMMGTSNTVEIFEQTAPRVISTTPDAILNASTISVGVAVADLNHDGWPDIVTFGAESGVGTTIHWNNAGSFNGSAPDVALGSTSTAQRGRVVDMNGDGHQDIVLLRSTRASIWLGNGTAISAAANWTSATMSGTDRGLEVGDMDGNGWLDVVAASGTRTYVHLNRWGEVSAAPDLVLNSSEPVMGVEIGDVDADGDLDLLILRDSAPDHLHLNRNTALERAGHYTRSSSDAGAGIAVGDLNGDGIDDYARANGSYDEVYFGQGQRPAFSGTDRWRSASNVVTLEVAIGDVNGDGHLDLAALHADQRVRLYLGPLHAVGDSSYSGTPNQTLIAQTANARDLALGDVNGDGSADLVVVPSSGCQRLFLSDGADFATTSSWNPCGLAGRSAELADMNGDGRLDLLLGHGGGLGTFLNTGSTLSTSLSLTASGYVERALPGDMDGDGDLDVVAISPGAVNKVWHNTGSSLSGGDTFGTSWQSTYDGILMDMDRDGDLDLVVETHGNRLRGWPNDGSGVMAGHNQGTWLSSRSPDTRGLQTGDFDADGHLDLVVVNHQERDLIFFGAADTDGDDANDSVDEFLTDPTQSTDTDGDGYGDAAAGTFPDACTAIIGLSWRDRFGCSDEDLDGQSNLDDAFWQKDSQWHDSDEDGRGDNFDANTTNRAGHWPGELMADPVWKVDASPLDFDDDGFEDAWLNATHDAQPPFDDCVSAAGTSWQDAYGCPDVDQDGWSDAGDAFPANPTQWVNSDEDRYGDNQTGDLPDRCPSQTGNSTLRLVDGAAVPWHGCADTDGDGYDDATDWAPLDPAAWSDADQDGWTDQQAASAADACPLVHGSSVIDRLGCVDTDADGYSDADASWTHAHGADAFADMPSQWRDADEDGFGDNSSGVRADDCPLEAGTSQWNASTGVRVTMLGCLDGDGDGYADAGDDCPAAFGTSTGNGSHGCLDTDGDGLADSLDDCPEVAGTSTLGMRGCLDSDRDGLADTLDPLPSTPATNVTHDADGDGCFDPFDAFPFDPNECDDPDGDGVGNNSDEFPLEPSQWKDSDGDSYGDNSSSAAYRPDACPFAAGTSTHNSGRGCPDSDGDGWSNDADAFEFDASQQLDRDRDGYGDDPDGTEPDACPDQAGTSWRDGIHGCVDGDRDGAPDVRRVLSDWHDAFPDEPSQWNDSDGDGYGDERRGNAPDACPHQSGTSSANGTLGCPDQDRDGWADHQDAFPVRVSAWSDVDGDGFADQSGMADSDDCPNKPGTSTRPWVGCGDLDGDGIMDLTDTDTDGDGVTDAYEQEASLIHIGRTYDPEDASSVPVDTDRDGIPDLIDDDDDGDTWPDEVEVERGSDPLNFLQTPLNMYGGSESGIFYAPGQGFSSSYDPESVEVSLSSVQDLVTSEFLIPLLLLPASVWIATGKKRRFKRTRRKLNHVQDLDDLRPYDRQIDELIEGGKLRAEHGLLLRNIFERRRELLTELNSDLIDAGIISGSMVTSAHPDGRSRTMGDGGLATRGGMSTQGMDGGGPSAAGASAYGADDPFGHDGPTGGGDAPSEGGKGRRGKQGRGKKRGGVIEDDDLGALYDQFSSGSKDDFGAGDWRQ